MKLTNKRNLPQAFVDAVKNDGYTRGDADLSITQAIDPPQVVELERQYWNQLEEDVEDRVWSLMGQSIHIIMERANKTGVAERRLTIEIEGWKVSGGMDLYDINGTLTDYKTTSVWSLIYPDRIQKWEEQLNCYAVLLRKHGHAVNKLEAVAMCRDWRRGEFETSQKKGGNYPGSMVVNIDIPLWPAEVAEKFLRERVILHKQARLTQTWAPCTPKERWVRDEKWAVKKTKDSKRALDNASFNTEAEAIAYVGSSNLYIEHRPGTFSRCANYCPAAQFCPQLKSEQETQTAQPQLESETQAAG